MVHYNKNLISLKCVLFLFFGALGSLLPFLPLHMNTIGLSRDESTIISIVSPIVALIGPLVVAPLADRLAGGFGGSSRSKTGKYLRVLIAICLVFATLFYWLLLTIPPIIRSPPSVAFTCDESGGFILQDRCGAEKTCYDWNGQPGKVLVKNCIFSCNATTHYKKANVTEPQIEHTSSESTTEEYNYDDGPNEPDIDSEPTTPVMNLGIYPSPHMCYNNSEGVTICEVYTEYSNIVEFNIGLKPTITSLGDSSNNSTSEVEEEGTCKYPFANYFHCRITEETRRELNAEETKDCHPVVLCEIHDPYNNPQGLLQRSECGYDNISFWLYLFIRAIADIFPAAAVALLATAVVIATRETSTGRGDVGKQLAAGAFGFAIFPLIIGGVSNGAFLHAIICFTVLLALAVLILVFDSKMPLSPPEWWWHTRCGLLALPMSSVRKYGLEIAALGVVLLLLGIFWNAIDAFLPWHVVSLQENTYFPWNVVKLEESTPFIIGLTLTVGALPAVVLLIFAEKIVDYCSHANILIMCFVTYIFHHVALIHIENGAVLLVFEVLEIVSLHLMWITAILYLRHLVPRKFTACGQALPVVAHFCLGRCFGALLGSLAYTEYKESFPRVHQAFAVAAAVIAILYFVVYHLYLKPKCGALPQLPPYPAPSVVQSMNGNGSYTPLRVYHNGRAKKGHFRY